MSSLIKCLFFCLVIGSSMSLNAMASVKMTVEQLNILNARQTCPIGKSYSPVSDRPELKIYGTRTVIDFDKNGKIERKDIQEAIDRAHARFLRDQKNDPEKAGMIRVLFPKMADRFIYLDAPLIMKPQVLLDGNQQRTLLLKDYDAQDVFRFPKGTEESALYNLEVNVSEKMKRGSAGFGIVTIHDQAKNIYIYNNKFVSDKNESFDEVGNTNVAAGIHILSGASNVYIDQNIFSRVPTGINTVNNGNRVIKNIYIKNNWFGGWRLRAIYTQGNTKDSVRGIWVENNRIVEPALGTIRQPIAFAGHSETEATVISSVVVRNNFLRASGNPHKTSIDPETGKKITTTTDGTADMIGMHRVDNFRIINNCIIDGGELGTAVANGSRNGLVKGNYYENTDLAAISVGNGLGTSFMTKNITIIDNIIVNPSRNKLKATVPKNWAFVAIGVIKGQGIKYGNNLIRETERGFNKDGTPYTLSYAVGVWNDPNIEVEEIAPNTYEIDSSIPRFAITRDPVRR